MLLLRMVAVLAIASLAVAQTPVHNGITGGSGPSTGIFAVPVCATPLGSGGDGGVSHHAGGTADVDFQTTYTISCATGSIAMAMVSVGTTSPMCSTPLSGVLPGSSGPLIVDPTSPNFISLDLCAQVSGCLSGGVAWRHDTIVPSAYWPVAPGWTWFTQVFEWDANGDLHAAPWAMTHSLYSV